METTSRFQIVPAMEQRFCIYDTREEKNIRISGKKGIEYSWDKVEANNLVCFLCEQFNLGD